LSAPSIGKSISEVATAEEEWRVLLARSGPAFFQDPSSFQHLTNQLGQLAEAAKLPQSLRARLRFLHQGVLAKIKAN